MHALTLLLTGLLVPAQFGEVTYPLFGNIRAEQGTVLVQFRIDEPLPGEGETWYHPKTKHWCRFMVARLAVNDKNSLSLYWRGSPPGKGAMWTSMNLAAFPPKSPNLNGVGHKWQTGEVHTIAYTWDVEGRHRYYGDGELVETNQSAALMRGIGFATDPDKATLTLGSTDDRHSSAITIYAVHILDIPLVEEDYAGGIEALLQPHPRSLLLDRFDNEDFTPDGETQTCAEVITGFTGERGGVVSTDCRFIDTPHGRGLRMYVEPATPQP